MSDKREPEYGIYRPQVVADVEQRFQHKSTKIEFPYIIDKSGHSGDRESTALVFTDASPGSTVRVPHHSQMKHDGRFSAESWSID